MADNLDELLTIDWHVEEDYSEQETRIAIQLKQEELDSLKQDREQRKVFSYVIFGFVCVYMVLVLGAVILDGASFIDVSDGVLITLLGTTTIDIIGLFAIVARYLFPKRKANK